MTVVSDATILRLNRIFSDGDRPEAVRLLREDCTADALHSSTILLCRWLNWSAVILQFSNCRMATWIRY